MIDHYPRRVWRYLLTGVLLFILIPFYFEGCGFYSFSGSALKGVKSIAIPLFDNETTQYGIREELTEALRNAIITDNTLKIVGKKQADSALKGKVTEYKKECYTYDGSGNCSEYVARIFVDVSFEDLRKKEVIWEEKKIEGYGVYSALDESEDIGKKRAIEKLSQDIVDKIIRGW